MNIDHSIDVRNEPDAVEAFNKFIKKWCPEYSAHLVDSDDNDGEFMRQKIVDAKDLTVGESSRANGVSSGRKPTIRSEIEAILTHNAGRIPERLKADVDAIMSKLETIIPEMDDEAPALLLPNGKDVTRYEYRQGWNDAIAEMRLRIGIEGILKPMNDYEKKA